MTSDDQKPPDGDEIDVDLEAADENNLHEAVLQRATHPEGVEYLGSYPSIQAYLRAMLEPEVSAGCQWILDYLDWSSVKARWESDGSRLVLEAGQVYRVATPDLPGPWMPTRGA